MVYIGTTNFTQKNWFGSVWTGTMDRKRPVLGGSVEFPQYLGQSWTSCGPQLPVLGAKNQTELDLWTLGVGDGHSLLVGTRAYFCEGGHLLFGVMVLW